jgi:hypothetical protein
VIMVAHQNKSMHQPSGFCACLFQRSNKGLAILVIQKNRISPISPVQTLRLVVIHGPVIGIVASMIGCSLL